MSGAAFWLDTLPRELSWHREHVVESRCLGSRRCGERGCSAANEQMVEGAPEYPLAVGWEHQLTSRLWLHAHCGERAALLPSTRACAWLAVRAVPLCPRVWPECTPHPASLPATCAGTTSCAPCRPCVPLAECNLRCLCVPLAECTPRCLCVPLAECTPSCMPLPCPSAQARPAVRAAVLLHLAGKVGGGCCHGC